MFANFIKTAFRSFFRHKGFSLINIAGLTLGLTACLLIGLFVWDEKQYDQFIPEGDQVYRIVDEITKTEGISHTPRTPPMFAPTLKQQFPQVGQTLRILDLQSKSLFEEGDRKIYEEGGLAVEPSFFELFPLKFKFGSSEKVLDDPNSIILSEETAEKYFANDDPTGKQIIVDKEPFTVKGVLKNRFDKFHLHLTYLIPMAHAITALQISPDRMQSWRWQQFTTYVKLKPGSDVKLLQSRFQDLIRKEVQPTTQPGGSTYLPFFQPLKDIHLYSSDFKVDIAVRGNISYVKALTIIALFILLIACFNFINLATAKSLQRAKEVGVRKSIGASRRQLMFQFTGETILLSLIGVLISTILAIIFLPSLNEFTNKHISTSIFLNATFLLLLVSLAFIVGIIAGIYPALVLSSFKPVKVLKGSVVSDSKPGQTPWLRHILVIIQFSLSALLIVSAIVVYRQVSYLHNKDLGFDKEEIMFFPMRGDKMYNNYEAFKNELLKSSGISNVSMGYGFPGDIYASDDIIVPHEGEQKEYSALQILADHDYIKTMGMQIVAGRDFSKDIATDKDEAFIINETGVKELGFGTPEKAIGHQLYWKVWDSKTPDSLKKGQVIGVVKDFNLKSLYDKVNTTVIQIYPPAYWKVAVKMKTGGISNTVAYVKDVWKKFSSDYPIEYKFLDENFGQMYQSEDKLKTLLSLFTGIAIFVGCLGLFGLAAYSAERRRKEIGIRKVLGASINGLVVLLSKDFLKLVLIALIIASPIAWYFMSEWLQDFAYRINISWWMFALAGGLAILIALFTVGMQAVKAAIANPVESIRVE